jgi:hypothetical protein
VGIPLRDGHALRQAYVNGLVPSEQRATVLSFDSLMGSGGGVAIQPVLGRTADVWGYPASYIGCAIFQALAIPFVWHARRERAISDPDPGQGCSIRLKPDSTAPGGEHLRPGIEHTAGATAADAAANSNDRWHTPCLPANGCLPPCDRTCGTADGCCGAIPDSR